MEVNRKRRRRRKPLSTYKQRPKIEPVVTNSHECCFCKQDGSIINLGTFFTDTKEEIAAHQFCLLFSAGLPQLGEDEEGFDGFIFSDIKKEVARASKIQCKFCNNAGASCGCSVKSCRQTYHVTCGMKSNVQFMFQGSFETLCPAHRTEQDLSYITCTAKSPCEQLQCPICLEEIQKASIEVLKMPCCRNKFAHKECIQNQARVSGYFFKCPFCNNGEDFQQEMAKYGIYIPQRDAAWEENNAYSDLLEQYSKCDWPQCKCIHGRTYNDEEVWLLLRCYHCGQSGVHKRCLGKFITPVYDYICTDCNEVIGAASTTVAITPERVEERTQTHKRLLAELTARSDPLLLASPVLGYDLMCRKFNLRQCRVVVTPLPDLVLNNMKYGGRKIRYRKFKYYMRFINCKDDKCDWSKEDIHSPTVIDQPNSLDHNEKTYSSTSEQTKETKCVGKSDDGHQQHANELSVLHLLPTETQPSKVIIVTPTPKDTSMLPPISTFVERPPSLPEMTPTRFSKTAEKIKNITLKRPLHISKEQSSKKLKLTDGEGGFFSNSCSVDRTLCDKPDAHYTKVQHNRTTNDDEKKLFIKFPFMNKRNVSREPSAKSQTSVMSFQDYYRLKNNDILNDELSNHVSSSFCQSTSGGELANRALQQSLGNCSDSEVAPVKPSCTSSCAPMDNFNNFDQSFENNSQPERRSEEHLINPTKECSSIEVCKQLAKQEKSSFSSSCLKTKKKIISQSSGGTCKDSVASNGSMTLLDVWLHRPRLTATQKPFVQRDSVETVILDCDEEEGEKSDSCTSPDVIAGTPHEKPLKSILFLPSSQPCSSRCSSGWSSNNDTKEDL